MERPGEDNVDNGTPQGSGAFVPVGALVFVALLLLLVVAAWVGMYLLLLHRAAQ